jgi:hypothetical protein
MLISAPSQYQTILQMAGKRFQWVLCFNRCATEESNLPGTGSIKTVCKELISTQSASIAVFTFGSISDQSLWMSGKHQWS